MGPWSTFARALILVTAVSAATTACGAERIEATDQKATDVTTGPAGDGADGQDVAADDDADGAPDWGPLAVLPPADGGDDARNEGLLAITDSCVTIESPSGQISLLAFPSNFVEWSPTDRSLEVGYTGFGGETVTLVDGDYIAVGGSTIWALQSDSDEPAPSGDPDWIKAPDPDCRFDEIWGVNGADHYYPDEEAVPSPSDDLAAVPFATLDTGPMADDGTLGATAPAETTVNGAIDIIDRCAVVRTDDDQLIGLAWSTDQAVLLGDAIELPGFPAGYLLVGEEVELSGAFIDTGDPSFAWAVEPGEFCHDNPLWVAEVIRGGTWEN